MNKDMKNVSSSNSSSSSSLTQWLTNPKRQKYIGYYLKDEKKVRDFILNKLLLLNIVLYVLTFIENYIIFSLLFLGYENNAIILFNFRFKNNIKSEYDSNESS